jgi:pilus assembly protein Flp/PilA
MIDMIRRFVREDDGQDLVEYALLLALIALAAVTAMGLLGTAINTKYDSATTTLNSAS